MPMWQWNTRRCLKVFDKVYVSSDDPEILAQAKELGATAIERGEDLCGDTPNIYVYRHAIQYMRGIEAIVAVQANSPTLHTDLIETAKLLMQKGTPEVMTCHRDYSMYGSIWALTTNRIRMYQDPYKQTPEILLVDPSTDIHTLEDFNKALYE